MPPIDTTALDGDLLLRGVWEGLGNPVSYVTGGYIRDRLLKRTSVDLDLVLAGDLEQSAGPARRLAAHLDTRAHVLGRDEKRVWRIETPELKVELWPLGNLSLDQDIERRDFSCNALMWELPDGPLVDRVGGISDLTARKLRALSRANLNDDPVRLVRAPRLLAQLPGFELEKRSAEWIQSLSPRLALGPRERVGLELSKLLRATRTGLGFRTMLDLGLFVPAAPADSDTDADWLAENLGAFPRLAGTQPHPVSGAVRDAGDAGRLAFLLRAWGAPQSQEVASYAWLRSDRLHAARAATLVERAIETVNASVADRRWLIHAAGAAFPATIALSAATAPEAGNWHRWWRLWKQRGPELATPEPLLSGEEVMAILGLPPGRELGSAFRAVTAAQIRGEVRSRDGARLWLNKWRG
jgi:tRNA nucleotidyltransferase (CCA-adding enzyme)